MKCLCFLSLSLMATLITSDAALQEFINANNLFTASFYKEIMKKSEPNFLMSPYSAETVLAFVQSGCKGETAQEIRNSLHLPADNDKIESAIIESLAALKGNDKYTLHTANKMYVKEGFQINEGFKNTATDVYQANIENIDFVLNEQAADTMNSWVESQTSNKIKNLISPDILDNNTRTVLINALYFKGNWTNRFLNYTTKQEDFYKTSKDVVKVDTMHHYREWFNYCENSVLNAKFLELPFEGEDISMIIALPNEKEGLASLENQIEKVFAPQNFTNEFLNVALPKFKVESTLELKSTLKNLGVEKAFNETEADLSGIAGDKGDLVISDALQKTYIDVEEGGVEAAAATYVAVEFTMSAPFPPKFEPEPKEFVADHPFIFYIKAKDFIIFAGRVSELSH